MPQYLILSTKAFKLSRHIFVRSNQFGIINGCIPIAGNPPC
ncbi:hypothetical protein OHAE_5389 [Ochrobactrum soli]|uniref:Uncharacterized protein n=1 Tax=Ochrobactrum soli TaxID=2448455 RepID=A0A2P9HE13_9HYPH|nr:hypothetical protein OHAE_5389 [[Ochrobactrum] soli]